MKLLNKPIDVLVIFYNAKVPIPYRFKFEDKDDIRYVKVDRIIKQTDMRLAGVQCVVYQCQSIIDGMEVRYEIKFVIDKMQWLLWKM